MVIESKSTVTQPANGSLTRRWMRVLRPFGWWLLLVLVLFGMRTHQRLMEQTRLLFFVTLEDRHGFQLPTDASVATFDGRAIESGQMIPLGWHTFNVSHPKGKPFTTNLFVWYGGRGFSINLKRAKGTLEVRLNPPADVLSIRGPEYTNISANSPGSTSSVPTDAYVVEARYPHWRQSREVSVSANSAGVFSIDTKFSVMELSCNQTGATFQLLNSAGEPLAAGEIPGRIQNLSEGEYKLISRHRKNEQTRQISIEPGTTNSVGVKFAYGSVMIETEPPGAKVSSDDGHDWGSTPVQLGSLPVGHRQFSLVRNGYEPLTVGVELRPDQTIAIITNLVGINYVGALKNARRSLAIGNFAEAVASATSALQAKPYDPEATAVLKTSSAESRLSRAKAFGQQEDYASGIKELVSALELLPDSDEIKQLLEDFKKREPEQIEKLRVERLERPQKVFEAMLNRHDDATLFDEHKLTTSKKAKSVESAISQNLIAIPSYRITRKNSPATDTYEIEATLGLRTHLDTSAGQRKCLIVVSQTKDDETVILFKVLEYRAQAVDKLSIGAWIGTPVDVKYIPVHPARIGKLSEKLQAQVDEGIANVTDRIQHAIQ